MRKITGRIIYDILEIVKRRLKMLLFIFRLIAFLAFVCMLCILEATKK
jgi:hypothetical protein